MRFALPSSLVLAALAAAISVAPATPATAAGKDAVVTIANMRYGSIPAGLKVGDTIVWKNNDSVPHTVTARDKSFDVRLNPKQSKRMTLTKSGSFAFYCVYHVQMRGTLAVGN